MSAVTVLTVASQARAGSSNALDVTAFSTLRLNLTARADLGVRPFVRVYIETGPAATGPWRTIAERHYTAGAGNTGDPNAWPASGFDRITLGGFDAFVRCRWAAGREYESPFGGPAHEAPALVNIALVLGLTGDGKPD